MVHMPKVFGAIETLQLKQDGDRPKAVNWDSCVGKESVDFSEPLKLVGKVETYMLDVIAAMIRTLRNIAEDSYKAYPTMEKNKWIMRDAA